MDSNPSSSNITTPMGVTELDLGMPHYLFDPSQYQTPQQKIQCPLVIIEDITIKSVEYEELTKEKLLEMKQDPSLARALDALIVLDPNTCFLTLAKNGANLPSNYNIATLREKSLTHVMSSNIPLNKNIPRVQVSNEIMP